MDSAKPSIPSRSSASVALFVALLIIAVASPALAKPDKAKAKAHFEQAEAFFETGVFDQAAVEYKLAYEFAPTAHGFLFNIGLSYEKSGNESEALTYYADYLKKSPEGKKVAEATARKVAIERRIEAERNAREAAEKAKADGAEKAKRDAETKPPANRDKKRKDLTREKPSGTDPPGAKLSKGDLGRDSRKDDITPAPGRGLGKWAMIGIGAGLIAGGVVLDLAPENSSNGSFDLSDMVPPTLYAIGGTLMIVGVF